MFSWVFFFVWCGGVVVYTYHVLYELPKHENKLEHKYIVLYNVVYMLYYSDSYYDIHTLLFSMCLYNARQI